MSYKYETWLPKEAKFYLAEIEGDKEKRIYAIFS
jgi:hypothetical protein